VYLLPNSIIMGFRDCTFDNIACMFIPQRATEAGDGIVSHNIKMYASAVPKKYYLQDDQPVLFSEKEFLVS